MFSMQFYYNLISKMKPMVQISFDLPPNSLKERKFMK